MNEVIILYKYTHISKYWYTSHNTCTVQNLKYAIKGISVESIILKYTNKINCFAYVIINVCTLHGIHEICILMHSNEMAISGFNLN